MNSLRSFVDPAPTAVGKLPDPSSVGFRLQCKLVAYFRSFLLIYERPVCSCLTLNLLVYGTNLKRLRFFVIIFNYFTLLEIYCNVGYEITLPIISYFFNNLGHVPFTGEPTH